MSESQAQIALRQIGIQNPADLVQRINLTGLLTGHKDKTAALYQLLFEDSAKGFATRVVATRLGRGLKQEALAHEAKVSQGIITKIERAQVHESRKLSQLASALGVDANW